MELALGVEMRWVSCSTVDRMQEAGDCVVEKPSPPIPRMRTDSWETLEDSKVS